MKSNQLIIIAAIVVIGAWAVKVYAGTIQMNTYYPAPNGYYDTLTVRTKLLYPCYTNSGGVGAGIAPPNAMYTIDASCTVAWPF